MILAPRNPRTTKTTKRIKIVFVFDEISIYPHDNILEFKKNDSYEHCT